MAKKKEDPEVKPEVEAVEPEAKTETKKPAAEPAKAEEPTPSPEPVAETAPSQALDRRTDALRRMVLKLDDAARDAIRPRVKAKLEELGVPASQPFVKLVGNEAESATLNVGGILAFIDGIENKESRRVPALQSLAATIGL
ncbi:hypothetical protein [Kordiimonas sp.]|uniref:hypothetical protein n=1 Tax=Kordiimonas sp. TaxID=1970157 RepID=UPI003A923C16